MKKRVMLFLVIPMILSTGISASAKEHKFTIATSAGMEPFEYLEDYKAAGIDIEIGEFLAEDLDAELIVENMTYQDVLEAVKGGRIKVGISAIPIEDLDEDHAEFEYSNSYYTGNLKVLLRKESLISSLEELDGKTVGMIINYAGLEKDKEINTKITFFESVEKEMEALDQGVIDGMILDETTVKVLTDKQKELKVLEEDWSEVSYGIIVEKGNEDMLLEVNDLLALMQESGELQKIFEKYVGIEDSLEETEE